MTSVTPYRLSKRGFTLIELLIALAIFSVMSVTSYVGLQNFLALKQSFEVHEHAFAELQAAVLLIEGDMENLAARPIRDELGDRVAAFKSSGQNVVEFTRGRPGLPLEFAPVDLQRIDYVLEDNQLIRRAWAALDRTPDTAYQDRVILADVVAVNWQFLGNSWLSYWPLDRDPLSIRQLPRAVEITISLANGRDVTRVVPVINRS